MKPSNALIGLAIIVAIAALGWFSLRQSSSNDSSSSMGGMTMTAGSNEDSSMSGMDHSDHSMTGMSGEGSGAMAGMIPMVAGADGTKPSAGGLTLEPKHALVSPGQTTRWQLRVVRKGVPVTSFDRDQTKLMHLIVVRSDLTGYQHLHPTLGRGGIFSVDLRFEMPGSYRAIADFTTAGKRYALGVPVEVAGKASDTPLPAEETEVEADGYSVMLMHDDIRAGADAELEFTINKHGEPVTALLPYLGAYGHLVALKKETLAYSHVHPTSEQRAQGKIAFSAEFPTSGTYRLFLQFRTASGVHTVPFTTHVG